METLLRIGLSNAVAALLLALLVVTVACIWRRPAVLHALWLLVLVKLVTPPLVWLPEPWAVSAAPTPKAVVAPPADPAAPPEADVASSLAVADPASAGSRQPLANDPSADPLEWEAVLVPAPDAVAAPPAPAEPLPTPAPAPVASSPVAPWWVAAAFGLWLVGSLSWYALALVRLRRFRRLLRHAVAAPESLRQRTQRLAEKLRLRRRPAVWLIPGRVAPMLWAAGGPPRILFPSDLLGQTTVEQQNALLVHELAHLRRRDHWVRWLEFAASGLYWWNPVLWFARRELREAEEQCCDAWVTSTLPGAGKTYAVALLETLDFLSDAPPATPLLASGVGRVADLKRRLTMIMSGTTPRALGWRGLLAVLGLGALLLPLLPAWARAQPPAPKDDAPARRNVLFIGVDADRAAAPADAEKAVAELKELEAKLAQKQAEVAEIAAKIQALRATIGKADAGEHRIVVRVADPNVRYDSIREMLPKLREFQPGTAKVIVIDQATGKIIMEANEADGVATATGTATLRMVKPGEWVVVHTSPPVVAFPPAGVVAVPQPADADKRIDELEMKLKHILDEVEQLRKERRPDAPKNESGLHSYGPAPLNQLAVVGKLFGTEPPRTAEEQAKALAAERDALQKMLHELRTKADADKIQGDAAVEQAKAALDAAQARLEQAQAQLARFEQIVKAGAAPEANLMKESQADVAARQADLEAAKANLKKAIQDSQTREADIQDRLKAAEADRQAAEAKIRQLEEELRKLAPQAEGGEDAPKKP